MTPPQRFAHKLGNQLRKLRAIRRQQTCPPQSKGYYCSRGLIQDGTATATAKRIWAQGGVA